MEQDLEMLQSISDTLKTEPQANQRTLAQNAGMSIGLMNAVLKRFVERGWIMLTNVNGRKLAYAVTVDGIKELTERGKRFAVRTFKIANEYNEVLYEVISKAKADGKKRVVLYGKSYIRFLLAYVCDKVGIEFEDTEFDLEIKPDDLCIIGENEDSDKISQDEVFFNYCIKLIDIINLKGKKV